MRFIARLNAPTYPDADQSAPSTPMTSPSPAPCDVARSSSRGLIVSVRVSKETSGARISMILSIDSSAWPNRPTSDSTAIRPGKSASTE